MAATRDWADLESRYDVLFRTAKRAAFAVLRDEHDAEDAAGEALARMAARNPAAPEAWVARVAANVAIDRRRRKLVLVLPELPPSFEPDAVRRVDLAAALSRLSARQREAVVLRHLAGFSETEAATAIGVSVHTLKTHLKRAFATLRTLLGPRIEEAVAASVGLAGPEWLPEMDGPLGPGLMLPEPRNRPLNDVDERWLEACGYVRGYMRSWFHHNLRTTGVAICAFEFAHEHGARRWHRACEGAFGVLDFTERFAIPATTGCVAMCWKSLHTPDSWLTLVALRRARFSITVQTETLDRDEAIELAARVVVAQDVWLRRVVSLA